MLTFDFTYFKLLNRSMCTTCYFFIILFLSIRKTVVGTQRYIIITITWNWLKLILSNDSDSVPWTIATYWIMTQNRFCGIKHIQLFFHQTLHTQSTLNNEHSITNTANNIKHQQNRFPALRKTSKRKYNTKKRTRKRVHKYLSEF